MVNDELMIDTLAQIERTPSEWNQGAYRCGSGMCFAGWAATLAGGQWLTSPYDLAWDEFLRPEPEDGPFDVRGDETLIHGPAVHASTRARRLLGIDMNDAAVLFAGGNQRDDLYAICSRITGMDEQVLRDKVRERV